jgi:hypothetical protein
VFFLLSCQEEDKKHAPAATIGNTPEAPIVLTPGKYTIKLPVVMTAGEPQTITIPVPPPKNPSE